jgi:hypothetical protein
MRDSAQALEAGTNKRRHPRVDVQLAAQLVADEESRSASVLNVARGGAFVATDQPPELGAVVRVRFRMLATRVCEAAGVVVWRRADGSQEQGFAIRFQRTNHAMDCFLRSMASLPERLHSVYLADVLEPEITVD